MPVLVSRGGVEAGTGVGLQGEVRWGWESRHRGCEVLRVFFFVFFWDSQFIYR